MNLMVDLADKRIRNVDMNTYPITFPPVFIASKFPHHLLCPITGINIADREYLKEVRKLCDQNVILLIFDEVQLDIYIKICSTEKLETPI